MMPVCTDVCECTSFCRNRTSAGQRIYAVATRRLRVGGGDLLARRLDSSRSMSSIKRDVKKKRLHSPTRRAQEGLLQKSQFAQDRHNNDSNKHATHQQVADHAQRRPPAQKLSLVSPFTVTFTVVAFPLRQTVALYVPSGTSLIEKAPVASVCAK